VKVNCFGAMLDILLTTDYRIAFSHSQMGLAKMGDSIWPGMVVHRLTTQLGVANARSLVLFGSHVNAERARELGLINAITSDSLSSSQSFVQSLNFAHIQDIAMRRSLLFEAPASTYEDALGTHLAACDRALRRQVSATPQEDAVDTVS
jgi:isomerase DpgB